MTTIRHSSSSNNARRNTMIEKKSVKIVRLLPFFVAIILMAYIGRAVAQSPPSGAVQQSLKMEHLSAESAKRLLMQQLPPESVLVQVNPTTNEINLVGFKDEVVLAVQTLQKIDKPNVSPPQAQRPNTLQPTGRDDFGAAHSYGMVGNDVNSNAVQNAQNMTSASNLAFREPSPSQYDNRQLNQPYNPSDNAMAEGYEPGTYFCKPSHLNRMSQELQTRYSHDPNIVIETRPENGKILVWAPQRVQREITALMTQAGAWAEVPAGRDPREFEGTLLRFAPEPRPPQTTVRQPVIERTHSPNFVPLDQIEAKLQGLFGNRMTAMSPPEEQPRKYRVAIPQRPQGMIVCELLLDYPNYKIHIKAPQNIAVEMSQLMQAIDQESPAEGHDRRFISIQNGDVEQIRKLLDVYRSKAVPNSSRQLRNNSNMLSNQRNGNATRHPIQQVNYQEDGGLGTGFGQSGGIDDGTGILVPDPAMQMKIQVIPDLDIVVIDASMEEINRIMDMIGEIERLSQQAQSKIEILLLKHVNCEALDALLRMQLRISPVTGLPVYLYDEMFSTKQGRVWVLPLHNPNAMLVVGWGQSQETMKSLIEQLDQPVNAASSLLRVITLQHVPAEEVATVLMDFFNPPVLGPGIANTGFYPRIRALSNPRTNTLILQAAPNDYIDIERIIAELDVAKGGLKLQVRTFKMKNLLAADMALALNNALAQAINGTAEDRIPVIELILGEGQGRKIIESGFLTEVTIEAVDANNTLVVTAPGNCMPLIEELINMLDLSPGVAMVKVIPIKHSDASTILTTLTSIFPTAGTANRVALPGSEGGEIFIPLRFGTDSRSNSILVVGAENDIMFVEALIAKLDQQDALQQTTTTIPLRNSSARDMAMAVRQFIDDRNQLKQAANVSPYQMLQEQVIIQPDPISNRLIIGASEANMLEIENLIKDLDQEPPQVMIQVLIAEVTLGKADEFGIELGMQDPYLFGRSSVATGELRPGYNFNNPSVGLGNADTAESLASAGTVATQMLSNFATGRVNSDTGFGGLIFSASSDAVSVLIRAMQERSRVEVLSRPQIATQDNQLAVIFVGQTVSRITGTDNYQGQVTTRNNDKDVGLFLGVIPRISKGTKENEPDKIDMLISASNSSVGAISDGMPSISGGESFRIPNINSTRVETIISALDGETVLLGGLLKTDKQEVCRRVPFLSNIPIAGNLFKYEYEKEKRTELIIIMRPRVIRKSEDMEAIKRVEFARMSWCLPDVTKLHGDIGYYSTRSRQPVTGGAPSFTPEPVDMTQLRDLPMPQYINSDSSTGSMNMRPGVVMETSPYPSTLQPTPLQSTPMQPTIAPQPSTVQPSSFGYNTTQAPPLAAPTLPSFATPSNTTIR